MCAFFVLLSLLNQPTLNSKPITTLILTVTMETVLREVGVHYYQILIIYSS